MIPKPPTRPTTIQPFDDFEPVIAHPGGGSWRAATRYPDGEEPFGTCAMDYAVVLLVLGMLYSEHLAWRIVAVTLTAGFAVVMTDKICRRLRDLPPRPAWRGRRSRP